MFRAFVYPPSYSIKCSFIASYYLSLHFLFQADLFIVRPDHPRCGKKN